MKNCEPGRHHLANGMFKVQMFQTSDGSLTNIGQSLKTGPDADRYLAIGIRRCGEMELALYVVYAYPFGSTEEYEKYIARMDRLFRDRFGDGYIGPDMSAVLWVIK